MVGKRDPEGLRRILRLLNRDITHGTTEAHPGHDFLSEFLPVILRSGAIGEPRAELPVPAFLQSHLRVERTLRVDRRIDVKNFVVRKWGIGRGSNHPSALRRKNCESLAGAQVANHETRRSNFW